MQIHMEIHLKYKALIDAPEYMKPKTTMARYVYMLHTVHIDTLKHSTIITSMSASQGAP